MKSQVITTKFQEITVSATHKWKADGKQRQKTKKFMQTLNPFNRDSDGNIKTEHQIRAEIEMERDAWLKKMQEQHPA